METMSYVRCCYILGNGDFRRGQHVIFAIAWRVLHARTKHPLFAEGPFQALGVIGEEYRELEYAVEHETPERMLDEALDCMATLARLLIGEHEIKLEVRKSLEKLLSGMLQ